MMVTDKHRWVTVIATAKASWQSLNLTTTDCPFSTVHSG